MYALHDLWSTYVHPIAAVEKMFPGDREKLSRLSLIEGSVQWFLLSLLWLT